MKNSSHENKASPNLFQILPFLPNRVSLDRRSILAFLKLATASFDLFAAQSLQILPSNRWNRSWFDENWFNEVEGGGAPFRETRRGRIDACASLFGPSGLDRLGWRERERLQPSSTGSIRDIATSRVLTHVQNISKRDTHVQRGCKFVPGLSTGGRSMTRVKIFPLSMLLARPTFPSTTDSIRAGKDTFVSFHDELRFFLFNVSIFFFFFDWKNWKKSNERNWSYLQRFSPSIPHFLAPFP